MMLPFASGKQTSSGSYVILLIIALEAFYSLGNAVTLINLQTWIVFFIQINGSIKVDKVSSLLTSAENQCMSNEFAAFPSHFLC